MRSLVRIVAPVIAAVAIVLAGSSSALASSKAPRTWSPPPASSVLASKAPRTWAPPPASAPMRGPVTGSPPPVSAPVARPPRTWAPPPATSPIGDASPGWVLDDAWCNGDAAFTTCFEVKGRVQFLLGERGSGLLVNARESAFHYVDGVLVASDTEFMHERLADSGNGTYTVHVVTHTRVNDGDVTCSYQEIFRIVDFELVTDHEGGTCD
jgi:hypothetical protein